MMRRLLFLLPIAVLLAACGGGESTGESEQGGVVVQTIRLSENEFSLDPSTVTLDKPGTYEFEARNDGQITHALEIEGGGEEAKTGDIEPGATKMLRFTFSKAGSFEMYCPIGNHKEQGMEGTVTVGGAAGAGTTTDSSPGY